MKEINWSQAPDWATGFGLIGVLSSKVWFNDEKYQYIHDDKTFFFEAGGTGTYNKCQVDLIAKRPDDEITWNGKGLPPAETECEILGHETGSWSVGVVKYIDQDRCVWHWKNKERTIHNLTLYMKFRPLRSDRERWVEAALALDPFNSTLRMMTRERFSQTLYDAMQSGTLPIPTLKGESA